MLFKMLRSVIKRHYYWVMCTLLSGHGCQVAGFMTVFASQLSIFTLSLLTVERWFAIRHALYTNRVDLSLASKVMFIGWAYALLLAALPLFGISSYSSTRWLDDIYLWAKESNNCMFYLQIRNTINLYTRSNTKGKHN